MLVVVVLNHDGVSTLKLFMPTIVPFAPTWDDIISKLMGGPCEVEFWLKGGAGSDILRNSCSKKKKKLGGVRKESLVIKLQKFYATNIAIIW